MKLNWVLLLCIALSGLQAHAQQPASDPQTDANEANRERALKGGKLSPRQKAELDKAAKADANAASGAGFLASNKAKPGVVSLPSGVQYRILKAGLGKRPAESGSVRCRYQGTLIDGSPFDQAQDKTARVMRVSGFVPGLKEAVMLMPVGSKWEVVIPPELGYGPHGNRGVAGNAVLIYVIEILGIV